MKALLKALCTLPLLAAFYAHDSPRTQIFQTLPGPVTHWLDFPLRVKNGGAITVYPVLSQCYLGQRCEFSMGYFAYRLPGDRAAMLDNFTGVFEPIGGSTSKFHLTGEASGVDFKGQAVSIRNVDIEMGVYCRRGCNKYSYVGSFELMR